MTDTEFRPCDLLSLVLSGVALDEGEARAILHRKRVMDRLTHEAADRQPCRRCDGTGTVGHPWPAGSGQRTCPSCRGCGVAQ